MFEREAKRLDDALDRFRRKEAKLYTDDGERWYSDEIHEQKYRELIDEFDAAKDAVLAEAERRREKATNTLALAHRDPTDALTNEELERANAKRSFVADDCFTLSLPELTRRVKAAEVASDKVSMFLYFRFAKQRAEQEMESIPEGGEIGARQSALPGGLSNALDALDAKLTDPKDAEHLQKAEATVKDYGLFVDHAAPKRREADGTAAEQRRVAMESFLANF